MKRPWPFAVACLFPLLAPGCGEDASPLPADAGPRTFTPGDAGASKDPSCTGLCEQQVACVDAATLLTGRVLDPAGKRPVAGAVVYVPLDPLDPLDPVAPSPPALSCDRCDAVPGRPLVATLTDGHGQFVLADVPVGSDIPVIVQVGRWRRRLVIPSVRACENTPIGDVRLPRDHCEGELPRIALTTGGDDAVECWLRKIGIDDREFTGAGGAGRVHLYAGSGGTRTTAFDAAHGGAAFETADSLWTSSDKLGQYDLVVLGCEGDAFAGTKPPAALEALRSYTSAGGRVLASHRQRYWWSTGGGAASPFPSFATWGEHATPPAGTPVEPNLQAPKGRTLRSWLADDQVDAADASGQLILESLFHDVEAVEPEKAMSWLGFTSSGVSGVAALSANMPTDRPAGERCGRVTFADFHATPSDASGKPWPAGCVSTEMSHAEKALEHLLFDVTSCISNDLAAPAPPPVPTPPCSKCAVGDTGLAPAQTPIVANACDGGS